jgi:hypothetical protein
MWKNIVEPDRPQMTTRLTPFACWVTEAADTHLEKVILIAFSRKQWLRESATILLYA